MERDQILRRLFHLCAPAFLVFYLLPEDFVYIGRRWWVLVAFFTVMFIEGIRLCKRRVFFGMRDYEQGQLSAYAWAATGLTIGLLYFPMMFVIVAVTGFGWTDPLIGMIRRRGLGGYPEIPVSVYFTICSVGLFIFSDIPLVFIGLFSVAATAVAIAIERPTIKQVDDDFLMLVGPLVTLQVLYSIYMYLD